MPGHKALYGPMGTGVLLALDERLASRPLMAGGTGSRSEEMAQPDFLPDAQESGTPNVPGLAGLAAGIRFVRSVGPENILAHERRLAQETARALEGNGLLEVFSNPAQTGVLSVRFRDIPAESAAEQLARQGIAVRRNRADWHGPSVIRLLFDRRTGGAGGESFQIGKKIVNALYRRKDL